MQQRQAAGSPAAAAAAACGAATRATSSALPPWRCSAPLCSAPEQALELYTRAMEYFSTHLKYDKNPKSREMIQNKVRRMNE